ncbi:class I SAM-dependent methyltransferase [Aerosakkonema funiforme]|uniref:Class I SAM-dependent methyltransferase n=2 Tax=Oscillatoriophycideae TaxID=1301283 RepID=A0A926VD76_9CYAN|nr:class I SAM-dependent methyltransferase [Aerosakkonema funiforme]MBD2181667.1 class I SAM-dependent methyltransferase [Aerosakkonema funiforme FACHB-1375]
MQNLKQRKPDIGYIPTESEQVNAALALAKIASDDIVYDLGCGDGRVVIAAARQYGARGVGIDIDGERIREAQENSEKAGVCDRVQFRQADLFECDFSEATVVFLYLLPHLNLKLRPKLFNQLKSGTRIVSHDFDMGDWKAAAKVDLLFPEECTLYYWVISEGARG